MIFKDELKTYLASKNYKRLLIFSQFSLTVFLSGCSNAVILNPQGSVGASEKTLIIIAAALMLLVVVPAIFMTFLFAWHYRESNKNAKYTPDWNTSTKLEIAFWAIPSLIVTALSVIVWISCHELNPYRAINPKTDPINIQVVSLDWKWLFIYPDQQIATVNQIVFPVNQQVHFFLTSATVMNSFFIPALGSQIMTMAGMQTQLYLNANKPGVYDGISANFSGQGFTGMTFKAVAVSQQQFNDWVNTVKNNPNKLDQNSLIELAKPSSNNPVEYFSSVQPNLFMDIINSQGQSVNPPKTQE